MPLEAMAYDPMSYRFFDYPMPGSIYRLPDIPSLVRGPTYVKLPSGRDIEVPAQLKTHPAVPGQVHDDNKGKTSLDDLVKLLSGKRRDAPPAGYRTGGIDAPAGGPQAGNCERKQRSVLKILQIHNGITNVGGFPGNYSVLHHSLVPL